jgi:hypothetical protein
MEYALLTGLGLAAPAGLNAYLPLLILALAARFSDAVTLRPPYDFLATNWGIALLIVLLTIELVVDKVPGLDHANDLVQSAIRPAAGAILVMATTSGVATIDPVVALLLGLVTAGSVHVAKATSRPAITLTTGGLGNPLASVGEDALAAVTSLVAIFAPLLVIFFLAFFAGFVFWSIRRLRRWRSRVLSRPASTTLRR